MNTVLDSLSHLTVEEKLQLVQDLWDSIAAEAHPPPSDAVCAEVRRRAAWADAHPGQGKSLAQIVADRGVRL